MADERLYSEREVVLREREAAARARCSASYFAGALAHRHFRDATGPCEQCVRVASESYPLPKVEKPRVVTIPSEQAKYGHLAIRLRVIDRRVQYEYAHNDQKGVPFSCGGNDLIRDIQGGEAISGDFEAIVRTLAAEKLFERPTELVEDDSHV